MKQRRVVSIKGRDGTVGPALAAEPSRDGRDNRNPAPAGPASGGPTKIQKRTVNGITGIGGNFFKAALMLGLIGAVVIALGARAADTSAPKPNLAALAWLAGTWSFERTGRVVTERWTEPAGGMMIGTSHTVARERTVEYEFIVIRADAEGNLLYVAKPSGQAETAFKLVRLTEREAVFENAAHDYPQQISYTLKDDGTLLAAIDGTKNGKSRRVEFPYRRVK